MWRYQIERSSMPGSAPATTTIQQPLNDAQMLAAWLLSIKGAHNWDCTGANHSRAIACGMSRELASAINSCGDTTMVGFVSNRAAVLSSKANANDDLIRVAA